MSFLNIFQYISMSFIHVMDIATIARAKNQTRFQKIYNDMVKRKGAVLNYSYYYFKIKKCFFSKRSFTWYINWLLKKKDLTKIGKK